jgi:hypothetical protein
LILLTFILEKNLDTPPLSLIPFAQKVSTVLPPLELFSLERKGRLLPGGLFVCLKPFHRRDAEDAEKNHCGSVKKSWVLKLKASHPEEGFSPTRDLLLRVNNIPVGLFTTHLLYGCYVRR